jgi:sodium-dependent dicarboxylate transporter 2/3/5
MAENNTSIPKKNLKKYGLHLGIIVMFLFLLFIDFGEGNNNTKIMAAIAVLMSIWWITEAVPLAATSLIPLILFPLFGIISGQDAAEAYINSTIFLFMGGFIIAIAMEQWNLHKRIALNLINIFGKNPSSIILGFMIASAFLSMWISNTATAVMILPIGLAILLKLESEYGVEKTRKFSIALMLGIAYACSIGGIGTLIGTPPNLVFQRIYAISFPDKPEVLFGEWMLFAVPLSIVMLGIVWFLLTKVLFKIDEKLTIDKQIIKSEREALGKISYEEKVVLAIFALTALLWIFRKDLNLSLFIIPGWSNIFPLPGFIDDGTVAITMALLLFILPVKKGNLKRKRILTASAFRKIPWEIILLFGGGFALAKGFVSSGLSDLVGEQLSGLSNVPTILLIAVICFTITFLTELTSNTATAQIILPILAALSIQINIDPLLLMVPATISASMAFMMPVATPPYFIFV